MHVIYNYKCVLWIKNLTQRLCETSKLQLFIHLTDLTAHPEIPLPCKTSRPLTVQFLAIVQTSKGIRCAPRFLNGEFFHFSEESCSNTRKAGGGRQKRPIQQKI